MLIAHLAQGVRYKVLAYTGCMAVGSGLELVGYAGRIVLQMNLFNFNVFLINLGRHALKLFAVA
jgi:hypothetical protein